MNGEPVVVGDRYELGEPLGQGGMATVHRALDRRLDRAVAVKRLGLHLAADPTAQARFRREAQASASLNHPAIASVFDTGEGVDPATGVSLPYIVMELVEGSTLRTVLDAGPLPPERALRVIRSVLDSLAQTEVARFDASVLQYPTRHQFTNLDELRIFDEKVRDFGAAVQEGRPAPIPGEQIVRNQAVIDAILRSAAQGREVAVDIPEL